MVANLLSDGILGIPERLIHAHEELVAAFAAATTESKHARLAVTHLAELCMSHFAKEEENIFRVFGFLHDLATDRARADLAAAPSIIADLRRLCDMSCDDHKLIDSAVDELLRQARKEQNKAIAKIAHTLRYHEKIENEVMYPAILAIDKSLRAGRDA